jgi:hypothetical protein
MEKWYQLMKRKHHTAPTSSIATETTPTPSTRYVYPQLTKPHSIRLLRFLPETVGSDIHCAIDEYDTENMQGASYTALSYVWGDTRTLHPITLSGKIAYVTPNLKEALVHLFAVHPRAVVRGSLFWIDASCIDQSNPLERNHQVSRMRTIYGQAIKVVVWLGPQTERPTGYSLS